MSSHCPGEQNLRLLDTDALDEAAFAAIEEHVEDCENCLEILERLAHARRSPRLPILLPGLEQGPCIPGYEIRHELGRGAMGVVYLAFRTGGLERPVALKVLPSAVGADERPGDRRRWLREARAMASVRHPNVVTLYDYGEADGWFYLVLEYVPGGTLRQRLAGPLAPRVAAGLVETIARAVGRLHDRGLHHFDLKPSNILLDGEEDALWGEVTPKVSDFGLALSEHFGDVNPSETTLAGIRGTPAYMAPEQADASRDRLGAATDIHALGTILYEMLTGRPPFQGVTAMETLDQVRHQQPVSPRRLVAGIPRDLETITLKCLEKGTTRRYSSADDLADDLRRWLDGRPILARPASPLGKGWRWCRRSPIVAALTGSLALTLSVAFLVVLSLWRQAEVERGRAEANFQTASEVLGEIADLSGGEMLSFPQVVIPDRNIALMLRTRDRLRELTRHRPDQQKLTEQFLTLQNRLCAALMRAKRWGEAQSVVEGSLEHAERLLGQDSHNCVGLYWRTRSLLTLGEITHSCGKPREAIEILRRALETGEHLDRASMKTEATYALERIRSTLAPWLIAEGHSDEARTLLDANWHMLQDVTEKDMSPGLAALRVAARLDSHRMSIGLPSDTSSASWNVESCANDALSRLASPGGDRLPAAAWAELAARSLNEGVSPDVTGPNEGKAAYDLTTLLALRAADQRHLGRLDEARRIADRMLALARLLVARYPSQMTSYLALIEAYEQAAKNDWQTHDLAAVKRHWELALSAATRGLVIDPNHVLLIGSVDRCRRRLDDLRNSR